MHRVIKNIVVASALAVGAFAATPILSHAAYAGTDTQAPITDIDYPVDTVTVVKEGSSFAAQGTTVDDAETSSEAAVKEVRVALINTDTQKWLQTNGTWAGGTGTRDVFLATVTSRTTLSDGRVKASWKWTSPVTLTASSYRLEVNGVDNNYNIESPAIKSKFNVVGDTIAPSGGRITSPQDFTSWAAGNPQNITGVAKDRSNSPSASPSVSTIVKVKIAVRDNDTGKYLQADGTSFGTTRNVFFADLGSFSYDAGTGTWSQNWSWAPSPKLPTGEYVIAATAEDRDGNTESSSTNPETHVAIGTQSGVAYLTLLFGRTQYQQYSDAACTTPVTSSTGSILTLTQVAARLKARTDPISAVGNVTPNRTKEALPRLCISGINYATWDDLATLRNNYGWKFVSTGQAYTELDSTTFPYVDPDPNPNVTVSSLNADICGSLNAFTSHGHYSASGLFAYPNNKFPAGSPNASSSCFSFGRNYQYGFNVKENMAYPWLAKTASINGGLCNDRSLSCYDSVPGGTANTKRYEDPNLVARLMTSRTGLWSIVQTYRFVTGSKTSGSGPNWNCNSADWRDHWTSLTELYCWDDYEFALDQIPSWVVITDPKSVGNAWGRTL